MTIHELRACMANNKLKIENNGWCHSTQNSVIAVDCADKPIKPIKQTNNKNPPPKKIQ